jgi:translation initiation factor IF-2
MADTATKIRIFSLAKELGMDSKVLIEHCRAAGLTVKGSALASISPEEKDLVLSQISGKPAAEPEVVVVDLAPQRELPPEVSGVKLRSIRTMTPRGRSDSGRAAEQVEQSPLDAPSGVEEQAELIEAAPVETPVVVEVSTPEVAVEIAAPETPPEASGPNEPVTDEVTGSIGSDVGTTTADSAPAPEVEAPKSQRPEPMRREDYVPMHSRAMREMRPVGTPTHSPLEERMKARNQPVMPALAAIPEFNVAEKKKPAVKEPKAQKPTIRLTPEQLDGDSPLADRLKKASDDRKTHVPGKKGKSVEFTDSEETDRTKLASADAGRRARRQGRHSSSPDDSGGRDGRHRRSGPKMRGRKRTGPIEFKTAATIELPITVRSLSEVIGRPAKEIITALFKRGEMATINQGLDEELAWELCAELGVELSIKRDKTVEEVLAEILEREDPEDSLQERPAIVTILGHVDHGKTSLLDKIRSTNVVDGEAGGITQHIRSYQVAHNGKKITFVDTPGHAAFGEMRARGANVTDIIVLVVAGNDSVMPQTVECISHAKAAGVPIIVAMNKSDLPDINENRVLGDLSTHGIQPQEWGGDVEVVRTSAITGAGVDDLLETILLTAEISEFKANFDRQALGVCIEAFQDEGVGPIAWLVVRKGTLRVGDSVIVGQASGRIRAIYNDRNEMIDEAPASMPVKVTGLDRVPGAGAHFFVLDDVEQCRAIAEERIADGRAETLALRGGPQTLSDIMNSVEQGQIRDLKVILKADSPGSIEALKGEILKFEHPEVRVQILHDAVGGVNESDVYLASASGAVIVAFHVVAEDRALALAEQEGVEIRRYRIIYEVTEDIRQSMEGLLRPEKVQVATGRAIVLQTFNVSRFGTIAGCRVLNGTIERNNRMHVIRDQKVLNDYSIGSLRREKDDVKEVREGMECGIRLDGFNDVKEGDLLEAFRIDMVKRTLD